MSTYPTTSNPTKLRIGTILEVLVLCLVCSVVVLDWLSHLALNQDSTTYIAVTKSILSTGQLNYLVNDTNFANAPAVNPYIDQPPGFPYLLVPFLVILRDPMTAAAAAQSLYLILFFAAVYLMTIKLRFNIILRIVTLILFSVMAPMLVVYRHYWTETLFIALSIAAGCFAIDILGGSNRRRDWVLFCLCVALSMMIRYTGVANLILIAPLIFRLDTLRAAWHLFFHRITMTAILVLGILLIALSFLSEALPEAKAGIGPMQMLGLMVGSAGLVVGAGGLWHWRFRSKRLNQSLQAADEPASMTMEGKSWPVIALFTTIAPVLVWFARNQLIYGGYAHSDMLFQVFNRQKILDPFIYIWTDLLNVPFIPRPLLLLVIVSLLIIPFLRIPYLGMSGFRKRVHIMLLSAAGAHFVLVWSLSIVTRLVPIRERYFAPVFAFLFLCVLNAVQQIGESAQLRKWRPVVLVMPLVFLVMSGPFYPSGFIKSAGTINYPVERQLWSEIDQIEWTHTSSYFYSDFGFEDDGFIHQIFSGKPQGILWDPSVLRNPKLLRHILSDGVNPFIIVTDNGIDAGILDDMNASGTVPMEKISFHDTGFLLYYLKK